VAGDKPRWFTRPQTVTHPSTNQARRRVTLLIETNALPLSPAKPTSGQSNLTKRPHCRRIWTVHSYSPGGDSVHLHLIHAYFGPPESHTPNGISIGLAVLHSSRESVPIFTMGRLPPRNCPLPWGCEPPSNTWFRGPTQIHSPNSISIGSAVFAGLTIVSDRQTWNIQTTLLGL